MAGCLCAVHKLHIRTETPRKGRTPRRPGEVVVAGTPGKFLRLGHLPPQLGPHPGLHQRAVRAVPARGDPHHPPTTHPRHASALLHILCATHRALVRWLSQRVEEEGTLAWAVGWHPLIMPSPPSLPHLSSLRPLDLEFLQRLCRAVNVVPVIARADSLTIEEREAFRHRVIWAPGTSLGSVGVWRGQSSF